MKKILALLTAVALVGCTYTKSTTEGDKTETTSLSFNPGSHIWRYVIPTVPTGK